MKSQKYLTEHGVNFKNSSAGDVVLFGTSDFVFFSLTRNADLKKSSRFGSVIYRAPLGLPQFNHAWFYMVDVIGWCGHNTKSDFLNLSNSGQGIVNNYATDFLEVTFHWCGVLLLMDDAFF